MKNRTKKTLGLLLAVMFLFTSFFTDAMLGKAIAATEEENDLVTITKTVSSRIVNNAVDIILDVQVNEKKTTVEKRDKFDIVLLLDASNSMKPYAEMISAAAQTFVDVLQENEVGDYVHVAVVSYTTVRNEKKGYSSDFVYESMLDTDGYFMSLKDEVKVKTLNTSGNTPTDQGLAQAESILEEYGREDAAKIIVLFTDGEGYLPNSARESADAYGQSPRSNATKRTIINRVNSSAIDKANEIKSAGTRIYTINYFDEEPYVYGEGYFENSYYETMLAISSENPTEKIAYHYDANGNLVKGAAEGFETVENTISKVDYLDNYGDIKDWSIYDTYCKRTSLEEEALKNTFAAVARNTYEAMKIGSETKVTDTLPNAFKLEVEEGQVELVDVFDNKNNKITDLIQAEPATSEEGKSQFNMNLGTLVVDEDGNRSIGDLEVGTYTIIYKAHLKDGYTAEKLMEEYGVDSESGAIKIAFKEPASLEYVETDMFGNVQERIPKTEVDSNIVTVWSKDAVTATDYVTVMFYFTDKDGNTSNVSIQRIFAGENAVDPGYKLPDPAVVEDEKSITEYTFSGWSDDFTNVQSNLNVYGSVVTTVTPKQKGNAYFYNEGTLYDQNSDYVGLNVTAPKTNPDKKDTETVDYTFVGWKLRTATNDAADAGLAKFNGDYVYGKDDLIFDAVYDEEINEPTPTPDDPTPTPDDPTPTPDDPTPTPDDPTPTPDDPTPTPDDPTPTPDDPTPTPEDPEIIEDPEIPQDDPEIIEDPEIPQDDPEIIEDPEIPQEDPVVPQTGDKRTLSVTILGAAAVLSLVALLTKKKKVEGTPDGNI